MSKKKSSAEANNQLMGVVAIIVVAVFVVGVIIIFAKSLFSGVEPEVPLGLDTATVTNAGAADTPAPAAKDDESSEKDKKETKATEASKETTTTKAEEQKTLTVQYYAYLRVTPEPEGEAIICMSPGIVVNVLSEPDDNGYIQASFDNNGTMLSGWVHTDYLA